MNIALAVAGLICIALALGHQTIGAIWVLPHLSDDRVPATAFGRSSMTVAMLRVTWYIVTIFALALGILLLTLAWADGADPKTVLLRVFAAMWLAAATMALWLVRRRPRDVLRLPVPLLWVVVAGLLWKASM